MLQPKIAVSEDHASPIPPLLVAECAPGRVLTKRFKANGTKHDFTAGFAFKFHELNAPTWPDLLECLTLLVDAENMCVLRGALHPECPRADDTEFSPWAYRRKLDRADEPANILPASFPWVVYDFDETAAPFDLAAPETSIRAWHSTLPPELRAASSAFFPSASAHVSPCVRGKLVVWYRRHITGPQARAFASLYGADPIVGWCHQPNFFAKPMFDGCSDPLEGLRAPIVFEGRPATQPAPSTLKAHRERPAPVPLKECPPGDEGILAALGPQHELVGHRFILCGLLGGIMRKLLFPRESCAAVLREWLADDPTADIPHGVAWALCAWDKPSTDVSGEVALREIVGKAHAAVIVEACTLARRPIRLVVRK